jgi:hypothetical protein
MKRTLILTAALAAAAFAQPAAAPAASYTEVKAYLNLSDSQIAGLQAVQKQLQTAVANLQQQIATKQTDLQSRLTAGSTDAAAVGRLLLDITALGKQFDTIAGGFRDQAKNLLTADQKTKLKALEDASKLQPAIRQATGLLLIAPLANAPGSPVGAGPGGPGQGGPGGRGFGGPGGPGTMGMRPRM